jgi:hypothetical protein
MTTRYNAAKDNRGLAMRQILSPFQKYECFAVDGVDYLVVDYTIVQDKDDNLVEWASEMKFKRLKDHKHYTMPITKIITNHQEGRAKLCKCK